MMKVSINLKQANIDDAEELNTLINLAYRGQKGWTKETEIIEGDRTKISDIKSLIQNPKCHMLKAILNGNIVACISIEQKKTQAYIGTFAVAPAYQNMGLGKQVLHLAENYVFKHLAIKKLVMVVISQRKELIEFYEHRGYKRTGKIENYPIHLNVGIPKIDLTVEYLEKQYKAI